MTKRGEYQGIIGTIQEGISWPSKRSESVKEGKRSPTYRITELDPAVGLRVDELAVDKQLCARDGGLGSVERGSGGREGALEGGRGRDTAQSNVRQHGGDREGRMMRDEE